MLSAARGRLRGVARLATLSPNPPIAVCSHVLRAAALSSAAESPDHRAPRPRAVTAVNERRRKIGDFSALGKAKLTSLVVASAGFGFLMAGPPASLASLAAVTAGTALASASAAAWNQLYEIRNDALMARTKARPLPAGRLSKAEAAAFGVISGAAGVGILALGCNPLTAVLGASNIALYSLIYTPMKQLSPANTVVGSVVGAIPPVMGWAAATGGLMNPAAAALFATLFLWQMPHFYALAWRHRDDYARAGYKMISRDDPQGRATAGRTLLYALGMAALPLATSATGVTGFMFAVESVVLNAYCLPIAWRFYRDASDEAARKVFLTSLWYLPLFMALMVYHSEYWTDKASAPEGEGWEQSLERGVDRARGALRDACPHEWIKEEKIREAPAEEVRQACPVVVVEEEGPAAAAGRVVDVVAPRSATPWDAQEAR